jgi:hypothetical protein
MTKCDKFWYDDERKEVNLHFETKEIPINMSCNNSVVLDKTFGPLIFAPLRITPEAHGFWRVERERITQDENGDDVISWETIMEIDCQESISFTHD